MSATRPLESPAIQFSLRARMDNAKRVLEQTGHYNGISELALKQRDPIRYELLYSRLQSIVIGAQQVDWQNRVHFLAVSARLMRRILVDFARSKKYQKRGGGAQAVTLDEALVVSEPGRDLVALDEALDALAKMDERKAKVVEMRFFGGLSVEETAAALSVSADTVMRDWRTAKAWLYRELSSGNGDE